MIASLRGTVIAIELGGAVIECGGVGYYFAATPQTLSNLRRGEESLVYVTMVVREDAMTLFGFGDLENKAMFTTLQAVSGLGPKLALAALAMYNAAELAHAISSGDVKQLQRIPGVGKRTAERMIVDLKDKVAGFGEPEPVASISGVAPAGAADIVEALIGLGFPEKNAAASVDEVLAQDPEADRSTTLRQALALLGRK
ncbi:Holliday junction ATP-dependent DNA helicase RuvA [Corynebacterium kalinowskii]|uniref:Holliday junction branch migration complex subunit RuvA n=1 Tax=Corynebacterium kalinowskii TaxID=2675216 RepID=A0A6B8VD92_9CORY|nr:Holliday junction branch migration protein RuvA [Corynebacterium kalinowskii]QGU02143.1 Holliday junction ATP-dependent DNA helicase RuvA [Corynebacterium kalinowskii]